MRVETLAALFSCRIVYGKEKKEEVETPLVLLFCLRQEADQDPTNDPSEEGSFS